MYLDSAALIDVKYMFMCMFARLSIILAHTLYSANYSCILPNMPRYIVSLTLTSIFSSIGRLARILAIASGKTFTAPVVTSVLN